MKATPITKFSVSMSVYRHVQHLETFLPVGRTRELFRYLVAASFLNSRNESHETPFIPTSSTFIRKYFWAADVEALEGSGLIFDRTEHSTRGGRSREYRLPAWLMVELVDKMNEDPLEPPINLITGRRFRRTATHLVENEPELVVNSMAAIVECPFDMQAVQAFLAAERAALPVIPDPSAWARHRNNVLCFRAVLDQNPQEQDGVWYYQPAYKVQKTGRISHIRGGFQTCSREMKAAAFGGLQAVRNYDLKSSQVSGLIQFFQLAGLDASWLEAYRDRPELKEKYAKDLGVGVDVWKGALLSLLMGASTTPKAGNAIYDALGPVKIHLFLRAMRPLLKALDKWHRLLVRDYVDAPGFSLGEGVLINPTGKELVVADAGAGKGGYKSELAAFVLQGQEAAFIHHLTLLSLEHGYRVVANEHDGLITIGEIPKGAIALAAQRSGLMAPVLVEKPFGRPVAAAA